MADVLSLIKNLPVLKNCEEACLLELRSSAQYMEVPSGRVLFEAGEPAHSCYAICFGSIRLIKPTVSGKEVVMAFLRQGDFAGAGIMNQAQSRYPVTAIAHEDLGLLKISRENYLKHWEVKPHIAKVINQHLMQRMMEFQNNKSLQTATVPQRVASFLLRTLEQQPHDFGKTISIPLTRRDIAEHVGTSVETVIRILSEWTQKKWIHTVDQHIEILNEEALHKIVKDL